MNKVAPDRLIFFMSDVAHLLKTIRNCLNNSRLEIKAKRCLHKGGEKLLWQVIVDLFKAKRDKNLRKSYKLNAQNVFVDSYSAMKVKYAAEVLSRTVANDIEAMNWPETKELVQFIRLVNDWFDCMNGAFSTHGKKTRNANLNPYTSEEDPRFQKLEEFVQYWSEWREEIFSADALAANLTASFQETENVSCDPAQEDEQNEGVTTSSTHDNTPAAKKVLSLETQNGIEFTTMAFIGVTKFFLKEGTQYVNARVFSQDYLEQHFSKQRHRSSKSSNPNYGRYLQNEVNIHLQGQLEVRKRKGNTESTSTGMNITTEPQPKRKKE